MPSTNVDALLPFVNRNATSTLRVEANAQREKTSLFGQALDTVNPLQHVPGVSQAYRAVTGDKISEGAKFAGHVGLGAAVGGPVGAAIGAGVYLVESLFGAIFGGGKKEAENLVQAENMASAPMALAGGQAIRPGMMRSPMMQPGVTQPAMQGAEARAPGAVHDAKAASKAAPKPGPSLGAAPVEMSSDQFAALMTAFGSNAPMPTGTAKRESENQRPQASAGLTDADFAARMAANLDKLDALKRSQGQ